MAQSRRSRSVPLKDASILAALARVRSRLGASKPIPRAERILVDQMIDRIEDEWSKAIARILVEGEAPIKAKSGSTAKRASTVKASKVRVASRVKASKVNVTSRVKHAETPATKEECEAAREFVRWAKRSSMDAI